MKVGFVSLGCPKNQLDPEVMLHEILAAGYEVTTPMVISNSDAYQISTIVRGDVGAGMPLLRLIQKEV